jgi:hypothetical protein
VANTHKISAVCEAFVNLFELNKASLGIADVFYGDQALIPRTPAVTVESGPKSRLLTNTGFMTTNTIQIYFMVYFGKVQDVQQNKRAADQLSEAIEDLVHLDKQLGGLVVTGYIVEVDPGMAERGKDVLLKANRLTWQGTSKTQI